MLFNILVSIQFILLVVLTIIIWRDQQTIRRLESITQPRLVTPQAGQDGNTVHATVWEQLQRALPGSLWVISVPHAHGGHLVYTALMKEPTTTNQQMQEWAGKNAEPLNPLDLNHHRVWCRLVSTVFQKVKDGVPLSWADSLLVKVGYERHMPYPDIERAYRDFVSGTMRDPASSGTVDGLRALRDSAKQATLKQTHFDLQSLGGVLG